MSAPATDAFRSALGVAFPGTTRVYFIRRRWLRWYVFWSSADNFGEPASRPRLAASHGFWLASSARTCAAALKLSFLEGCCLQQQLKFARWKLRERAARS